MKSLSNLLKSGYVSVDQSDVRIIDYNQLMEQRMEERKAAVRTNMEPASQYENGDSSEADIMGDDMEGAADALFAEGLPTSEIIRPEPVYEGPSSEEIAAQAREEADGIIARAQAEAERMKADAREAGRSEGYEEGIRQGMAELEVQKAELAQIRQQTEADYRQRVEQIEPLLVETITGIYRHVFQTDMSHYSDIVLYLLENTIRNVEGSRDFLVHVSKNDYPVVNMRKKQLQDAVSMNNVTFEVIEDVTLRAGECFIETEGGIFDCGIGTQLEELERELKLLSYKK